MAVIKSISLPFVLLIALIFIHAYAATISVQNNCNYTVWAAATPRGGQRLDPGQQWIIDSPKSTSGRVWARTGCNFNQSGRGRCETGDCNGLLQCETGGLPPYTTAEYAINEDTDYFDISLVDGFNLPMIFSPTSGGCLSNVGCTADINEQCPIELRAPSGCNHPCTVFNTDLYCCLNSTKNDCGTTYLSRFFKNMCPKAYSYSYDDQTTMFTCAGGTNYEVVFCPSIMENNLPYSAYYVLLCN